MRRIRTQDWSGALPTLRCNHRHAYTSGSKQLPPHHDAIVEGVRNSIESCIDIPQFFCYTDCPLEPCHRPLGGQAWGGEHSSSTRPPACIDCVDALPCFSRKYSYLAVETFLHRPPSGWRRVSTGPGG